MLGNGLVKLLVDARRDHLDGLFRYVDGPLLECLRSAYLHLVEKGNVCFGLLSLRQRRLLLILRTIAFFIYSFSLHLYFLLLLPLPHQCALGRLLPLEKLSLFKLSLGGVFT